MHMNVIEHDHVTIASISRSAMFTPGTDSNLSTTSACHLAELLLRDHFQT